MSVKNPQLPNVSSKYGAPMGRTEYAGDFEQRCRCFRLRFIDECYDEGGAYWGMPANVYCALSDTVRLFRRADSRKEAKARFKETHPKIKWIN